MKLEEDNKNGLKLENLIDNIPKLSKICLCRSCKLIINNGVSCKKCERIYCKNCIYINNSYNCLKCNFNEIENLPKFVMDKLKTLKFSCFYKENGCDYSDYYLNIIEHEKNCVHKGITCKNYECQKKILKKYIDIHLENCDYLKINCEFCSKSYSKVVMNIHIKNCDFSIINCIGCNNEFKKKDYDLHYKICDKIKVKCEFCKKEMYKNEFENHDKYLCIENIKNHFYNKKINSIIILKKKLNKLSCLLNEFYKNYFNCFFCKNFACISKLNLCFLCNKNCCGNCLDNIFKYCKNCKKRLCSQCIWKNSMCLYCNNI